MTDDLPLPKYHQVYLVLREQLAEGRFVRGVPGEMHLMKEFGVARVTVRKALERLVADGLIERSPGRGTVPVAPPANGAAAEARAQLTGAAGEHRRHGPAHLGQGAALRGAARLGRGGAAARPRARHAGAEGGARAVHARGAAVAHHHPRAAGLRQGLRPARAGAQADPDAARRPRRGHRPRAQSISAKLADAEVARLLQVDVGSALLAVQRLVFDANERPVQWLQGLYRPDRYQYQMQLSRVGGIDAKLWVSEELSAQFH